MGAKPSTHGRPRACLGPGVTDPAQVPTSHPADPYGPLTARGRVQGVLQHGERIALPGAGPAEDGPRRILGLLDASDLSQVLPIRLTPHLLGVLHHPVGPLHCPKGCGCYEPWRDFFQKGEDLFSEFATFPHSHCPCPSGRGLKCPLCSKFVASDEVEVHLVMCLTKPRISYNEDVLSNDVGECAICLEDLMQGDTIARLPCLCVYHKPCIDSWFEVNRTCPEHPSD